LKLVVEVALKIVVEDACVRKEEQEEASQLLYLKKKKKDTNVA
jgi:hypothetical protein